MAALAALAGETAGPAMRDANTVAEAFTIAAGHGIALGDIVADAAWNVAAETLGEAGCLLDVVVFDATGALVGRSLVRAPHGRNLLG